ncbi:hypothetical protein EST38_g2153 [Candolleomyces aberdarensis]|uniref:Uncharacterized protein n=1 Tax=Candolleomyces aberdarensis TaxID=2316362 RepID=A0A4Q2DVD6_9AGAR|nr:hypothetical protein EST38_g2153 [Candolleomyces aberdarensis]
MAHDLRTTIAPVYDDIVGRLLKLLQRSISPEALTVLLETFNTLFRFLLVPSIHLELLESTWTSIKSTLPKCLPEIQRAMAEVWGSVLRKLKSTAKEKAVQLLAAGADDVDDASAWVLVYACKSVSQTLHTATPSIINPLIAYHLKTDNPDPTFNIIRRTFTALIHHVKNAEQFSSLGNVVLQQFKNATDDEQTKRILNVATIVCSVRQGSRLTDVQKTAFFSELEAQKISPNIQASLLPFATSLFMASEMALWLSHGMKFLQRAWGLIERPSQDADDDVCVEFALRLNGSLAELGWGGWKLIALPLVLKMSIKPNLLEKHTTKLFAFLAVLRKSKKISSNEVDLVWRTKVEKCALERLNLLKEQRGVDVAIEVTDILTLSSFFSETITSVLIDILDSGLGKQVEAEIQSSAWILGTALETLSRRDKSEWSSRANVRRWANLILERWTSSAEMLDAIVTLSQNLPPQTSRLPFNEVYPKLQDCLLSHSRGLRLSSLRFLTSNLVSAPEGGGEVLKRCLQGEEASLDVQGVRERVLRIGRVGQVVGDRQGAELCARWLIAQLKVNLRPLWSPATAAISSLSSRFGDLIWELLFTDLKGVSDPTRGSIEGSDHGHGSVDDREDEDIWEEERSWRDPSAHKLRVSVGHWIDDDYRKRQYVKSHQSSERFDRASYEYQLLSTLGEASSLAEKHNRELVPYFLSLASGETSSSIPKQKLVSWLTLFSKFSNPKALHSASTLKSLYTSYLSHPFRPLQRVALDCLYTYKSPQLTPWQDRFKTLLDDTRWRDELTNLDLGHIEPQGREEIVDILIRLLFGFMLEKRGRSRGADRRSAVLGTLGSCSDDELGLLVDLMLQPLGFDRNAHGKGVDSGEFAISPIAAGVNGRQVSGYLTLLGDVMRLLGSRLTQYWPALLGTTIDVVSFAQAKIQEVVTEGDGHDEGDADEEAEEEAEEEEQEQDAPQDEHFSPKVLRSIRQLGLKRLADFFRVPIVFPFEPYLAASFKSIVSPRLEAFARENIQSPSAILDLLHVWSSNHQHAFYLVRYDGQVLPALYNCLVAQNVKPVVVDRIFDVIERVLSYAEVDQAARDEILLPHVELLLTNLAILVEQTRGGQSKSSGSLSLSLTTPLGQRHLAILSLLSPFATSPSQAATLLGLFLPLLKKPNKQVPEKAKANILTILRDMIGLIPELRTPSSNLWSKLYSSLSSLFSTLRTRAPRQKLVEAFTQLEGVVEGEAKEWLHFVSSHLALLNAYSAKRIDEPDFDRRLAAYSTFNDDTYTSPLLLPIAWIPILNQAFHDIQDVDEFALRSAAGYTLRRLVEVVADPSGRPAPSSEYAGTYEAVFLATFLPALRTSISTPLQAQGPNATSSFAVKADLLSLLSFTISHSPSTLSPTIATLKPLLEDGDEEANFFNNVLHIQIHRRTRAIRRLGERCDKGEFERDASSGTNAVVRDWLLPIVTWFIGSGSAFMKTQTNVNKEDQQNHLTTNEAIGTLGKLSAYLGWSPYLGLVQRYLRLANTKDDWEKVYVRSIVSILENFGFEVSEVRQDGVEDVAATGGASRAERMDVDGPGEVVEGDGAQVEQADEEEPQESRDPRRKPNILASLKGKLLPSLLAYLSPPAQKYEDDSTPLTVRLPIALAIARLTLRLPGSTVEDRERKETEMRRLATELSHMMKSRSQEVRDAVRDVLGRIALTVLGFDGKAGEAKTGFDGDNYLKVIVDELETALTRGPQLHILVTTVNSITTKIVAGAEGREDVKNEDEDEDPTAEKPAATGQLFLDKIVPSITSISSRILFGDVSSNSDANSGPVPPNHISPTFREPRQSLNASYSLYAFAAQYSSPSLLPELLRDVKGVMGVTSNVKVMTVLDEVLRRVGGGLERNRGIEQEGANDNPEADWLVNVIWGLISGNVAFLKEREDWSNQKVKKKRKGIKDKSDHIVERTRNPKVESDQYAHNSYRFIVLGLDLLHTALRRGRFSQASPTVYKQLDALLPVLGNTLYSTSTAVLLHALKCVALLVTRFPIVKLPGMRRALPVYVNQILQIIQTSGGGGGNVGGTDGDLMQGALRALGVVVRDGPKTTMADGVLTPGVELKEKDLSFLLELVTPDLEDPEKQAVAFTLLRAIVSRRFVVPEMYDIMEDQVAPLLVQSQSSTVREQARALLLQFMLDYPQGKGRLQKTLAFLLRNASSYVHESGRSSILELLGAILQKFQTGLVTEYGEMIFVSLVMVLANDDSSKCREMAASLIATLYGRLSEDERKNIVRTWLKKWVRAGIDTGDNSGEGSTGKRKLAWIALQAWGIVIEAAAKEQDGTQLPWLGDAVEDISQSLRQSEILVSKKFAADDDESMDVDGAEVGLEWQLPYYSLTALGKALRVQPALAKSGTLPWSLVAEQLLFPHAWVRTAACRALGQLLGAYPLGSSDYNVAANAITASPIFNAEHPSSVGPLRKVAGKLCDQLKSEHLDGALGLQVVKNLIWIGRLWLIQADGDTGPVSLAEPDDSEDEEGDAALQESDESLGNLPWLFSKLSYQVRGALIRRRGRHGRKHLNWSQQPLAVLRWFAAMTTHMDSTRLEKFLTHILSPVYRIIEEDTIKDEQIDELRTTGIELRELVQQKVGGTVFSTTYNVIRQRVLEVRRERKNKRLVMATLDPAHAAKRKEKKTQLKKESRKRKERSFVEARGKIKRRKES